MSDIKKYVADREARSPGFAAKVEAAEARAAGRRWQQRGPFFVRLDGNVVTVRLGNPDHPEGDESEHITTIHKSFIKDLIAALRAAQESK